MLRVQRHFDATDVQDGHTGNAPSANAAEAPENPDFDNIELKDDPPDRIPHPLTAQVGGGEIW